MDTLTVRLISNFGKSKETKRFLPLHGNLYSLPRKPNMVENPHFKELLRLLNEFEVEYLIVGGFAVMKYSEPRYTKDLDVWVNNSLQNSLRLVAALRRFGAPLDNDGITEQTFNARQIVYQLGVAPVRIDILTEITGVTFPHAWSNKVPSTFYGVPVHFIAKEDLLTNKEALGREVDVNDLKKAKNTNS